MTDLWMPGARRSPQPGGVTLNTSLPPRGVWHITWDALRPDGGQPDSQAVSDYLKRMGYCPTLMWNPFTGDIEQFYAANVGGRALAAWNEDGTANIQIEVFFSPGCVVDGIKYGTVADTPCNGLENILAWMDTFGIPRTWPMGAPQWQGNSRDPAIWNTQAGHYGHCNVPDNTHTDPGPMPDITGGITPQGTITPQEDAMTPDQMLELKLFIQNEMERRHVVTRDVVKAVPATVLDTVVDGVMGDKNTLRQLLSEYRSHIIQITSGIAAAPANVLNQKFTLPDGTVTNLAGILAAIHATPAGTVTNVTADPQAIANTVAETLSQKLGK